MASLLDRHRSLLRLFALAGVLMLVVAGAASLGKSRTAATRIPLSSSRTFSTHALPGFPSVAVALPRDWTVETPTPTSTYGGTFLVATENGTAPRTGTSLAPEGPRRLSVELHRLPSAIPPLTFLQNHLGLRGQGEQVTIAGLPGVAVGLAANASSAGESSSPWVFSFVAATALPGGDLLVLKLEGPGRGADTDAQLFNRLLDAVSLPGKPLNASPLDPLDALRTHPVLSPTATLPPSPAREVAVVPVGSDVVTLELFSAWLPPPPPLTSPSTPESPPGTPASPPPADPDAYTAFREVAIAHDSRFAVGVSKRLAAGRILLTLPDTANSPPTAALAVYADHSPNTTLAAILIARGQSNAATDLVRILNRAADRLTFAPSSDDLPAMLASGESLAVAAARVPVKPLSLAFYPPGDHSAPLAIVRFLDDGTVESLRPSRPPHRILRTAQPSPGNSVTVQTTRQVATGNTYVDALPRSFTIPIDYLRSPPSPPSPSSPPADGAFDLLSTSRYIPGHRLLQSLPLLKGDSAIVVCDSFPLVDFDTHSRFSFLLIQRLPKTAAAAESFAVHSIGTGRTLLVSFDSTGRLTEVEAPGQATGKPVDDIDAERLIQAWK